MQKNETKPPFIPHTGIISKWIKDLNVKLQTIKILEENIGSKISDIACSNILLHISPSKGNKRKNKQMELHQTENFFHSKGKLQQSEKTTHRMEEHIASTSDKGLISKIYEVHTKQHQKNKQPNLKMGKGAE